MTDVHDPDDTTANTFVRRKECQLLLHLLNAPEYKPGRSVSGASPHRAVGDIIDSGVTHVALSLFACQVYGVVNVLAWACVAVM